MLPSVNRATRLEDKVERYARGGTARARGSLKEREVSISGFFSSWLSRGLRLAKGPSASSDFAPRSRLVRRLEYQSDVLSEGGPHP